MRKNHRRSGFPVSRYCGGQRFGLWCGYYSAPCCDGCRADDRRSRCTSVEPDLSCPSHRERPTDDRNGWGTDQRISFRMERSNFVQRNRIIAGMSDGTLIVESPRKGGSLITADMADGYHRTVMAVPGRIDDSFSEGTNHLIRSLKACMVCSGKDVLDALGWEPTAAVSTASEQELFQPSASFLPLESRYLSKPSQSSESLLAPESFQLSETLHSSEPFGQPETDFRSETKASVASSSSASRPQTEQEHLLSCIGADDPVSVEELSIITGIPVQKLAVLLLDLELSGAVRSHHGGFYVRSKV